MKNKIYLIANWKMQLLNKEAENLATQIIQEYKNTRIQEYKNTRIQEYKNTRIQELKIILCPTFTALSKVGEIIKNCQLSNVPAGRDQMSLGSQDVFEHEKGAYTGEVSTLQLKELGVEYVIVGHSERRQYLKETDEDVNRKVKVVLDNNLVPILCVGETFDERRIGKTDLVLIRQVSRALADVKLDAPKGAMKGVKELIIAYEPVWVIGSGQAIAPTDAEHAARVIKQTLLDFFDQETIEKNIAIIYGGSVDESNINDFIIDGLLDGVLVGGASLTKEKFMPLIRQLTNSHE